MGSSSIGLPLRLLPVLLVLSNCQQVEWDASNFPNPTAGDYKRCNMRTTSNICDPDEILTESQRYRLNHELHQLESRTRQDHAPDFCQKKGITAAMAIVKHVRGGSEAAVKEMANQILRKWTLDDQCQKSVVFVVATEDRRFWVARDPRVPVYAQEFTQIFTDQKQLFQQGNYPQALGNILQQTWDKALSKQGGGAGGMPIDGGRGGAPDRGGYGPPVGPPPIDSGPRPDSGKKRGGLLPHIPFWVWLALILAIIPLLCCCCLCYCCCCKKGSGSSPRRQGPSDVEGGGGGPMGGGAGGRGGGMNSFLGGLGGAGLGHLAGRLMGGGGGGGGGLGGLFGGGRRGVPTEPGYQGGGAYPAPPFQPSPKGEDYGGGRGGGAGAGGKGLYPSAAVRDEGGGGGW